MSTFATFHLDKTLLKTLQDIGYKEPTPIQKQAIPQVLEGGDMIASAQTGTGKTAAFLLPALQMISKTTNRKHKGPELLVLVPTRELAMQVAKEAKKYSQNFHQVQTVCIYGGVPYPIQKRALSQKFNILVATPGRLLDHLQRGVVDLSNLKMLVLDEADRMLDMGFIGDVEKIAAKSPKQRQTLLFSATIDKRIKSFSKKLLRDPFEITIKPDPKTQANIEQKLYYADNINHKNQLLNKILETIELDKAIIFTSTKSQADKLSFELCKNGYPAAPLHGDMDQRRRTRTIGKLRNGKIQILVATDVAGRGIDIPLLSHVINFDLTFRAEDFIHRIGRTGRAGAKGVAITFATHKEAHMLSKISTLTGSSWTAETIQGLEPKPKTFTKKPGKRPRNFNPKSRLRQGKRRSGPKKYRVA